MTHSYISTESWTYIYEEFRLSMSFFQPDYYTCSIVWVLDRYRGNTTLSYWFQGRTLLKDDQNYKRVGKSKRRRIKYQGVGGGGGIGGVSVFFIF